MVWPTPCVTCSTPISTGSLIGKYLQKLNGYAALSFTGANARP